MVLFQSAFPSTGSALNPFSGSVTANFPGVSHVTRTDWRTVSISMLRVLTHEPADKRLKKLLDYTDSKLPALHTHLRQQFKLHPEGHLTWENNTNKASQMLSGCVPESWWEKLYRKATETLSPMPTESERVDVDHMAANYSRLLNWLQRALSITAEPDIHKTRG